jgi:class 3 adenylate cyclase/streptogramin lyase
MPPPLAMPDGLVRPRLGSQPILEGDGAQCPPTPARLHRGVLAVLSDHRNQIPRTGSSTPSTGETRFRAAPRSHRKSIPQLWLPTKRPKPAPPSQERSCHPRCTNSLQGVEDTSRSDCLWMTGYRKLFTVRRRADAPERLLTTVLFTDIVGSTDLASELGDKAWRQILSRQQTIVRRHLKRYGGREIDTAGDGFFATFPQPAKAVACARAVTEALSDMGIRIRAGIHMGEVELIGRKVAGVAVHIGSRIMSSAAPGEVLVSSTVRDLMSGSEVKFEDRGVHELKGVPAPWRLYAVERETGHTAAKLAAEHTPSITLEPGPRPRFMLTPVNVAAVFLTAGVVLAGVLLATEGEEGELLSPGVNRVARIDASTDEVLGAIRVGTTPIGIAAGEGGVWVTNFDDQTLQRIDPITNEVAPARALLGSPAAVTVGGGFIWVTSSLPDGNLYKIDPTQAHATVPIPIGVGAEGVAFGEGAVWVTNSQKDQLLKIDPQTTAIETINMDEGSSPKDIAVGAGSVWVGETLNRRVVRFDASTGEVIASVSLLRGQPNQIALGQDFVWVTNTSDDSVTRIDPTSNQGTTISDVGNGPTGVAATEDGIWVANSLEGTVARIEPRSTEIVTRIKLGSGLSADGIAVAADAVWVTLHSQ